MASTFISTALLGLGVLTEARVLEPRQNDEPCTVLPVGGDGDDVPNILEAVERCGNGGTISLPAGNVYNINQRMTTHLEGSILELGGTLLFSDDIEYWTENSYRFDFQDQSTAWRIIGSDYVVDGGPDMGGIDGNGQAWYTYNEGEGNRFGRPMPLHIVNSTRATFQNLSIVQPQFWAVLVDSSSYIDLDNFYVNATDFDNDAEEEGTNWVVNTDGIDTYRSDHITITNWLYQGGDDCVAFKGNSTNIYVENFVAYGGPGVAFGSMGQYPDRYDILENITIKNVQVQPSPQYTTRGSIYFKAWIGVQQGDPPNGGGGGSGHVRNVTVEDFVMRGVDRGPYINTCLSYSGDPTEYCDTSTFSFSDMHFRNITGDTLAKETGYPGEDISFAISLICSAEAPCENLTFEDIDIELPDDYDGSEFLCANAEVEGLDCEEFERDDDDDDDDDDE